MSKHCRGWTPPVEMIRPGATSQFTLPTSNYPALAELRDSTLIKLAAGLYNPRASGETVFLHYPQGQSHSGLLPVTDRYVVISVGGAVDNLGSLIALILKD